MEIKLLTILAKGYSLFVLPFIKPIYIQMFGEKDAQNLDQDSTSLVFGHISTLVGGFYFTENEARDIYVSIVKAILIGLVATLVPLITRHIFHRFFPPQK